MFNKPVDHNTSFSAVSAEDDMYASVEAYMRFKIRKLLQEALIIASQSPGLNYLTSRQLVEVVVEELQLACVRYGVDHFSLESFVAEQRKAYKDKLHAK